MNPNTSNSIDSDVSKLAGRKNAQAKMIRKVLNAVIHLIKAQDPDNIESALKEWGFRKDKF